MHLSRDKGINSGLIGARFNRMLDDNTCLFDLKYHNNQGDFVQGTWILIAGQIAVRMSAPNLVPDSFQSWDVEPMGTVEGTTDHGLVIRIPLVRFWRYHDTGLDATPPARIVVPLQNYGTYPTKDLPKKDNSKEIDLLKENNNQYAEDRDKLTAYANDPRFVVYKPFILSLIADADELRNTAIDPLTDAMMHGLETPNYSKLHFMVSNADTALDEAVGMLENRNGWSKTQIAENGTKRLFYLHQESQRISEQPRGKPSNENGSPSCEADKERIAHSISSISALIEQADEMDKNSDSMEIWLTVIHADMLNADAVRGPRCSGIGSG